MHYHLCNTPIKNWDLNFYVIALHTQLYIFSLYNLVQPENGLIRSKTCSSNLISDKYVRCLTDICLILGNDQLDTQLLYFTIRLLWSSTCFQHYMLIIRRLNFIHAASGIVTLIKWLSGAQVERELRSSYFSTCAFSSIICSSSGGWIVFLQHLLSSLSISGCPVHRKATCWEWRYQMLHQ